MSALDGGWRNLPERDKQELGARLAACVQDGAHTSHRGFNSRLAPSLRSYRMRGGGSYRDRRPCSDPARATL